MGSKTDGFTGMRQYSLIVIARLLSFIFIKNKHRRVQSFLNWQMCCNLLLIDFKMSELILLYFIPSENQAFLWLLLPDISFCLIFVCFIILFHSAFSLENPRRFTDGYFRLERSVLAEPLEPLLFETNHTTKNKNLRRNKFPENFRYIAGINWRLNPTCSDLKCTR